MKETIMNKKALGVLLIMLFFSLVIQGCGTRAQVDNFVREGVDFTFIKKVAILPLQNNSRDEFVGEFIRDIAATQLLSRGLFDVVDKGEVDSFMRLEGIQPGEPLGKQTINRIGQQLGVQALLLGTIDLAEEKRLGSAVIPELILTLRLLDVQSGLQVWQASGFYSGYTFWRQFFGMGARDSFQVSFELYLQECGWLSCL
jgi:TolB-like protein